MKTRGWLIRFTYCAVFVLLVVSYQNCSNSSPAAFNSTKLASSSSGGNGGGYDGKLYVQADLSRSCSDGDIAKARIVLLSDGTYQLVRSNCANLPVPQAIVATVPELESLDSDIILYQGKVFDSEDRVVAGTQLPTRGYCRDVTQSANISVPQTVGTDFDVSLVISNSGNNLMASMMFDDNSSSDAYVTSVFRIGIANFNSGPLVGIYQFSDAARPALQFDFNFIGGEARSLVEAVPVTDADTPSVTGTVDQFDSTLTECFWN